MREILPQGEEEKTEEARSLSSLQRITLFLEALRRTIYKPVGDDCTGI